MGTVNIFKAKTQFSRLLERVQKGEEITLAKVGVPIAKLVSLAAPKRELGFLRAAAPIDASQLMAALDDESLADWQQSTPSNCF